MDGYGRPFYTVHILKKSYYYLLARYLPGEEICCGLPQVSALVSLLWNGACDAVLLTSFLLALVFFYADDTLVFFLVTLENSFFITLGLGRTAVVMWDSWV